MTTKLNLDRLIKVLKMTTSTSDGEATAAIRRANAILAESSWTWESLLLEKVKIVADPFAHAVPPRPATKVEPAPRPQPTPPPPRHAYAWQTPPKPAPQPKPTPRTPQPPPSYTSIPNRYSGPCYCCGTFVPPTAGFAFKGAHVTRWEVTCQHCEMLMRTRGTIPPKRAPRKPATLSDLDNLSF